MMLVKQTSMALKKLYAIMGAGSWSNKNFFQLKVQLIQ